jgi:hypothetical protein
MKKLISLILASVFFLSTVGMLGGCNKKQVFYDEMSLDSAYNLGYLTQEHLKSIAYYYNKETTEPTFELIPKVELDKKIEDNIKLSYLQRSYIKSRYPNATVNDIRRFEYYGTYDGCAVVFILATLFKYDLKFEAEHTIGEVTFYNYCELSVYKIIYNEFN